MNTREFHERLREERDLKRLIEEGKIGLEQAAELAIQRQKERQKHSDAECARRARCRVRRLCRQYGMDHMITLTFPGEGLHVYDRALRLVQDFIHDHGKALHRGRPWLAVPEIHPEGHGWHWHVLLPGRMSKSELKILRFEWTEYLRRHGLPPSGGAEYTRVHIKAWGNPAKAAFYAAKYVGKAFDGDDRQKGRKRYLMARGLDVPVVKGGAASIKELRAAIYTSDISVVFESQDDDDWRGPAMIWAAWD